MPLQINYTDNAGVNHPSSYWKLEDIMQIDRVNCKAVFQLKGYHTKAMMEAGKQSIGSVNLFINNDEITVPSRVDGVVTYNKVNKTDFTDYLSTTSLNPEGENPYKKAYEYAKAKIALFANAIDVDV